MLDADADGDDNPTQPYLNVDGVDPTVSDPWRLLEPSAWTAASTVPSEGSIAVPQGGPTPSNPVGVSRAITFWGTSISEFDAESPIGEHGEDSPTSLAIPGPADSGPGGGPMSAVSHTTSRAEGPSTPSARGYASGSAHPAALPGLPLHATGTRQLPAGCSSAGPTNASPLILVPEGAGVGVSRDDRAGLLFPPVITVGVPHRNATHARSLGERWHPGLAGAGGQPSLDRGCYHPPWESCRLQDLERDLEDAQATCQALSSEQDRRLQELQRIRADLHRSEGDLSSIRREHATVSGILVRQRARTRSLEEEGCSLRQQLADAQRAARDVAGQLTSA